MARVLAITGLAIVICAVIVHLSISQNVQIHGATITTLLGFLGLAMTSLANIQMTDKKRDKKNEEPTQSVIDK